MTPGIAEFSEQWEGRTIEDGLTLGRCLGKGADTLVFLTDFESRPAAIKILPIEADHADAQLHQWTAAAMLSHPNLLKIFKAGRCQIDDIELLYIVMERADESLSEVLPQRALTVVEARQMLEPTASALAYLHGREWFTRI